MTVQTASKARCALLLLLSLVPQLAGCSSARVPDHVLRIADGLSDYRLDPYFVGNEESSDMSTISSAALVLWNDDLEVVPDLLTEVPSRRNGGISRDFRHLVLHLRRDLRWSDGAPLTANDVVFTAHKMTEAGSVDLDDAWQQVQSIRAPDASTVVIETRSANADFVKRFLYGGMRYVLPAHVIGTTPLDRATAYHRLPVGAGPFRYTRIDQESEIDLEANPFYADAAPKLKRLIVKVIPDTNLALVEMRSGELDLLNNVPFQDELAARAIPNVEVHEDPRTYDLLNLQFNVTSPTTGDVDVRRALRIATNRPEIAALLTPGAAHVFEEVLIPEDPMHVDLPFVPFDPARARRMLDAAGWRTGPDGIRMKNGKPLTLDMLVPANEPTIERCVDIIRSNWERVGVRLAVQRELPSIMYAENGRLKQGRFDVTVSEGRAPASFLDFAFSCKNIPPGGFNVARYCDPVLESIFAALNRTDDVDRRHRLYGQAQQRIEDEAVTVNLVQLPNITVVGRRVHGIHYSPWNFRSLLQDVDAY